MTVTCGRDGEEAAQLPKWRRQVFLKSPPGNKYHLHFKSGDHFSFMNAVVTFKKNFRLPEIEIMRDLKVATTEFWDANLKSSKSRAFAFKKIEKRLVSEVEFFKR